MDDFSNTLTDLIIKREMPRLENIMKYVGDRIQEDLVMETYGLIDAYYEDYTSEKGRIYIRTDEARNKHPQGKNGKFKRKNGTQWNRSQDKSLITAVKSMEGSNQPAIGVSRPLTDSFGYMAGVIFDRSYFDTTLSHSVHGKDFSEWDDVVINFLEGRHGTQNTKNPAPYITTPSADSGLSSYINNYKFRFDKHYNDALRKFK